LIPDNYQEDRDELIAHRTSPTNIGLQLLSTLAAHDFGYLSTAGVIDRLEPTFGTLVRTQRYRGHFYNWYDTRTLVPLAPTYISTVDSGNFAGYLLTLTRHGDDDPILTVASPPAAARFAGRALLAGLLSGVGLGCLGPCATAVLPATAMPVLAGTGAPYWGWVPIYLLVGVGSLWRPETRRFGAGLLAGGAIVGGTVAGIFSG